MGRHSCCNQQKVKRGLWSPEEDEKLIRYITTHGYGCWSEVPEKAGLQRCGKSCRLRWINYLRPDIRRGRFTPEEEKLIIRLHGVVGNRWVHIASHFPGRTDNEIKNYWNSWIKKKIRKTSASTTTNATENSRITYALNHQLDLLNQDLVTRPQVLGARFPSTPPLFMFDTSTPLDGVESGLGGELFQEQASFSAGDWSNPNEHQVQAFPTLNNGMDTTSYLPPLLDNMVVPVELQSYSFDEEGEMTLECLQRKELMNDWDESRQCSNFLFWDKVEGPLDREITQDSTSIGATTLSSLPWSLKAMFMMELSPNAQGCF
ncbi:hypothetical protein K2173_010317 [Erythroxylum novogranatense]|uniref:Uncharacterized protein n=1 Tax=Erythroxylum novogranatense TaxID=1862640 RepID=A0AAV8TDJ3_9ROSI|nr:hypothetical protein K2173_010317 [Erythroxylum novogranatense]